MVDVATTQSNVIKSEQNVSIFRLVVERIERRTILAILSTVALIVVIFLLIFHDMPDKSKDVLNILVGALIMLVKEAFSYDFGSTVSSTNKDDTIKQVALAAPLPQDIKDK